jgi:RHS repeat-associated protein
MATFIVVVKDVDGADSCFGDLVDGCPGYGGYDHTNGEAVIPHANWRGHYDSGTFPDGTEFDRDVGWPASNRSVFQVDGTREPPDWFGSLVGGQKDQSGLMYMRNRYYDPMLGGFTQQDPIGLAGGLNLYGFAGGDPVNFSDPFGLCPSEDENPADCPTHEEGEEGGQCKNSSGDPASCPDMGKVIQWLDENAEDESQGLCARYCRMALEAGGFDSRGRPGAAGDYGPFLESRGAVRMSIYSHAMPGHIAVFGKNDAHPFGHIAIFSGEQWISDFKQRSLNPYRDPASAGPLTIYRFPNH